MTTTTPKKLVQSRDDEYGGAWKLHGLVIGLLLPQFIPFAQKNPKYQFPWELILNKLLRALASPKNIDHWKDIQGYAQLVIDDIEEHSS